MLFDTSDGQAPRIALICAGCERPSSCTVFGEITYGPGSDESPFRTRVALVQCEHCKGPLLVGREYLGDMGGREYSGDGWDDPFFIWPSKDRPPSPAIPEGLRSIHEEARTCFKAKAYRAAVVMVRRTIEGVCAENGIKKSDLRQSLEALKDAGVIEGRLVEWAQELRVMGNRGAHYTDESITRQDAQDALELAEALLDYVFVLTAKFREFQLRRGEGKA